MRGGQWVGLAVIAVVVARPVGAQGAPVTGPITFPAFTSDQSWARETYLYFATLTSAIDYAKSRGQTVEEYGRWVGTAVGATWGAHGSRGAISVARGMQNNFRATRGTTIDVLSANDTAVVLKMNRPYTAYFTGTPRVFNGVTIDEFETVSRLFYEGVAKQLGLRIDYQYDSLSATMTITGRGPNAVYDFARATYASAYTPADVTANPSLAGAFEWTYSPDGKYTVRKNGQTVTEGSYTLHFDEITLRGEEGSSACPNDGKYRWTINPTTGALSLGILADECTARLTMLTRRAFLKK